MNPAELAGFSFFSDEEHAASVRMKRNRIFFIWFTGK
jgi:hypothetical protein